LLTLARLLVVDDDQMLLEILSGYLTRAQHEVVTATCGNSCIAALEASTPDLVVLDVNMPGPNGYEVLRTIRPRYDVPVIMLTARAEEPDVLEGFALGADDYVSKPFSFAELEARVRAVLSRTLDAAREDTALLAEGDLQVDLDTHRVSRAGESVKLTPTEFRLLVALMEQPGKIFSPAQLVRTVWGDEYASDSDYVRRYIWYLRRKIEQNPDEPRYIRTERNIGYYFAG
jgi:two-component system KDP operon response regulator KdpE